jgi:hypothetical protein
MPKGLFYGGSGPSQVQRILRQYLPSWIGSADLVLHLDFHTGLGRWGTYELLLDRTVDSSLMIELQQAFGAGALRPHQAEDRAYAARGSLGAWCQELLPQCAYICLCAEFGTYSARKVLAGLRAENQVHHWGGNDRRSLAAKPRLRELLCPKSPAWREKVLADAQTIIGQAVEMLTAG